MKQVLEEILSKHIDKRWKILNTNITNLVPPGENFGGELLKLDVTTEEETTKEKNVLHLVAKKIPVFEFLQEMFNVQVTFKAESLFYETIVPILQDFQRRKNVHDVIDCFAKFYGSRLNLNGSSVVDRDAVMIMENLVMDGYKNLDRFIGYNLEEAQLVLKNLANLHASVLAIKIKEPDIFKKEIRPLCRNELSPKEDDPFQKLIILIEELLLEDPIESRWVPQVKEVHLKYGSPLHKYESREPFATFSHCDLWINNIMLKHKNGKPSKVKLVDFQLYNYKSPVLDVLNLLMTSVQTEVLEAEFDNLIKYYHSELILKLQQLGVDTDPFSYQHFEKELKIDSPKACGWMLIFIPFVVFGQKNRELEGIDETDFTNKAVRDKFKENLSYTAKQRLFFMIKTFGEKGWLDVI